MSLLQEKKKKPNHFANSDGNSVKVFAKWRATVRSPWMILFSLLPTVLELQGAKQEACLFS